MDRCDKSLSCTTSGTEVPLRETLARFVGWPRLSAGLFEHQALASSTGVPWCGLSSLAPWSAASVAALLRHRCGLGVHSLRLGGELQRLGFNHLRELLDSVHQRFLGLSHLLSNSIVRLRLCYRERSVFQDLSNLMTHELATLACPVFHGVDR